MCATVRLNSVLAGLASVPMGTIPSLFAKVRSSEFRRVCHRINILDSQLSPSSTNLVPAQSGKVTVGLASHWPCVTDTVVYLYIPTGSTAKDREMSTHAYVPSRRGTVYHLPKWQQTLQGLLRRHTGESPGRKNKIGEAYDAV